MTEKLFTINILNRLIEIPIQEVHGQEITTQRVKNHILGLFENVKYNEISLYIETNNNSESELDDNEILDEKNEINCYIEEDYN